MKREFVMRNSLYVLVAGCFILALAAAGCEKKPTAANSSEAINQAQTIQTADEKENYLLDQAKGFINTKQYSEAITTAQYVLANVKQDSQAARNVLEKATAEIKATAEKAANDMKGEMNKMLNK